MRYSISINQMPQRGIFGKMGHLVKDERFTPIAMHILGLLPAQKKRRRNDARG